MKQIELKDVGYTAIGLAALGVVLAALVLLGRLPPESLAIRVRTQDLWPGLQVQWLSSLLTDLLTGLYVCLGVVLCLLFLALFVSSIVQLRDLGERLLVLFTAQRARSDRSTG